MADRFSPVLSARDAQRAPQLSNPQAPARRQSIRLAAIESSASDSWNNFSRSRRSEYSISISPCRSSTDACGQIIRATRLSSTQSLPPNALTATRTENVAFVPYPVNWTRPPDKYLCHEWPINLTKSNNKYLRGRIRSVARPLTVLVAPWRCLSEAPPLVAAGCPMLTRR